MVLCKTEPFFLLLLLFGNNHFMAKNQLSYSESYAKLQKILSQIESNELDIDELSSKIKEASSLLKICKDKLFIANEETRKIIDSIN